MRSRYYSRCGDLNPFTQSYYGNVTMQFNAETCFKAKVQFKQVVAMVEVEVVPRK